MLRLPQQRHGEVRKIEILLEGYVVSVVSKRIPREAKLEDRVVLPGLT